MTILEGFDAFMNWVIAHWDTIAIAITAVVSLRYNLKARKQKHKLAEVLDKLENSSNTITQGDSKFDKVMTRLDDLEKGLVNNTKLTYNGFLNSGIKNKAELHKWVESLEIPEGSPLVSAVTSVEKASVAVDKAVAKLETIPELATVPTVAAGNRYATARQARHENEK